MNFLKLIPVILSFLLLAAHFYRAGILALVFIYLIITLSLLIKELWVARLSQVFLVIGALEWVRTLLSLVEMRQAMGMPWTRLAMILGGVALFTGLSALVFQSRSLKKRYD
ncbi:MAG: hypothetical protein ISR97_02755 [Nitrospira sp.]|nr:hypothetical protein [Nitrospira sp.]